MIVKIRHRGLRAYYEKGISRGINADWLPRIQLILSMLDVATTPEDMDLPALRLHPLKGSHKGFWSLQVTGNWRIIFRFDEGNVTDVDLVDYH